MKIDQGKLEKAVRKILNQNTWPEYETDDDRGLHDYEYVRFIQEVLKEYNEFE